MSKIGSLVPNVKVDIRGELVSLRKCFDSKRGVLIGVPGAFTPVCTQQHLPGFRDRAEDLRKYVDFVACVSVNDPYVMKAWAKELGCSKDLIMIADWEGKMTRALGMSLDASDYYMGSRCKRFAMVLDCGTIAWIGYETHAFVEHVESVLQEMQMRPVGGLTPGLVNGGRAAGEVVEDLQQTPPSLGESPRGEEAVSRGVSDEEEDKSPDGEEEEEDEVVRRDRSADSEERSHSSGSESESGWEADHPRSYGQSKSMAAHLGRKGKREEEEEEGDEDEDERRLQDKSRRKSLGH